MTSILASTFEPVSDHVCLLGEGPCYHPRQEALYWLDIKGHKLFRISIKNGRMETFDLPTLVSAVAPAQNSDLVCAFRKGFGILSISGSHAWLTPIARLEDDLPSNRFNDGKLDPFGGFWAGTMDDAELNRLGSWWHLSPTGQTTHIQDGVMVTNGPAFNADGSRGYMVDSADQTIFTFKPTPQGFSDCEVFQTFGKGDGYPDGILVDSEDCLWAAFWDGHCLRRFSADGVLMEEMTLPASRPTSLEIIGEQLFVTTASIGLKGDSRSSFDGKLLSATLSRDVAPVARVIFDDTKMSQRDRI